MTITTILNVNKGIRAPEVRVIDENSKQMGIMKFWDAYQLAQSKGLDLVEVVSDSKPPVCKIMDHNKFLYNEKKKEKEQKKAQRSNRIDTKEIQLNPVIQEADLQVKIKNIQRLLDEGNKVRVVIRFSGRQVKHAELSKDIFEKIITALPNIIIEKQPVFEERNLFMLLSKEKS